MDAALKQSLCRVPENLRCCAEMCDALGQACWTSWTPLQTSEPLTPTVSEKEGINPQGLGLGWQQPAAGQTGEATTFPCRSSREVDEPGRTNHQAGHADPSKTQHSCAEISTCQLPQAEMSQQQRTGRDWSQPSALNAQPSHIHPAAHLPGGFRPVHKAPPPTKLGSSIFSESVPTEHCPGSHTSVMAWAAGLTCWDPTERSKGTNCCQSWRAAAQVRSP